MLLLNVAGSKSLVLKPDRLDLDDLGFEAKYSGIRVAIDTIHAKTVMTESLADRLKGQGIDVNSFHPGAVKGDLGRGMSPLMKALFAFGNVFLSSTSRSGVFLSTDAAIQGTTGQYFVGRNATPLSFNQAYKDALWERTERMLKPVLG